jgi:hypothetical protein
MGATGVPRPIAYLMGLSGLTYLMQGWVVGSEGFSRTHTTLILVAWALTFAWMIWLVVVAWRMRDSDASRTPRRCAMEGGGSLRRPRPSITSCRQPGTVVNSRAERYVSSATVYHWTRSESVARPGLRRDPQPPRLRAFWHNLRATRAVERSAPRRSHRVLPDWLGRSQLRRDWNTTRCRTAGRAGRVDRRPLLARA